MHSRATSLLVSGILFVVSLFLTAYSSRRPESSRIGQELLLQLTAPLQTTGNYLSSGVGGIIGDVRRFRYLAGENEELKAENSQLQLELVELRERREEMERLRSLVRMVEQHGLDGISARIVGKSVSAWRREITIAAGSIHGVKRGQGVISSRGVVGRVSAVSPTLARVLLISDPSSGVAALLATNRATGIVVGRGEQFPELRYLSPDSEVSKGVQILTSGFDTVFPSGIPIGEVMAVHRRPGALYHEVVIRAAAEERALEEVFVLAGPRSVTVKGAEGPSTEEPEL